MIYNFDGEKVIIQNFTNIDYRETKELEQLKLKWEEELKESSIYVILMTITWVFSILSLFFIFVSIYAVIFALTFIIPGIVLTRQYIIRTAHTREKLKILEDMIKIAEINDEERHKEKIKYNERKRLEELDAMKQTELKIDYKERNGLPPRKPKK